MDVEYLASFLLIDNQLLFLIIFFYRIQSGLNKQIVKWFINNDHSDRRSLGEVCVRDMS